MKAKIREDISAAPLDRLSFDSRGLLGACVSNLLVHLLSPLFPGPSSRLRLQLVKKSKLHD
jgi:hypothetical protein